MKKFIFILVFAVCIPAGMLAGCNGDSGTNADEQDQQPPTPIQQPDVSETQSETPRDVLWVSAASGHMLVITQDGTLWGRGWGSLVGDGTGEIRQLPVRIMENVAFAVAGHTHSFAITNSGELWAWGDNRFGQLGDGTTVSRLSPVKIMDDVVYVAMPQESPNSHVGSGNNRSYAIKSDGTLWAWGDGSGSESPRGIALGDGGTENRLLPVQILTDVLTVVPTFNGGYALTTDGRLWHWHGHTLFLQIENDEDEIVQIEAQYSPAVIMEDVAWISPSASYTHTAFAINTDGELWLLGVQSELGLENLFITDNAVYATGFGSGPNFAITADGTLWAWGRNQLPDHWQPSPLLGDGTTIDRSVPVAIMDNVLQITIMGNVAYAIDASGTLWAWGSNGYSGILGDGGTEIQLSPVRITENVVSVSPAYSMLDHGWVRGFRTFALINDGSVLAWGENGYFNNGLSFFGNDNSETQLLPIRIIEGY